MFRENLSLAQFSSYKIGGPARFFCAPKEMRALKADLEAWHEREDRDSDRVFVLGGGTNLLIPEAGFNGLVLKPEFQDIERNGNSLRVGSGVLMSRLLEYAVREGLAGLEWAGGLPGTLGGAVRGNAGCFGGEIKDVVESVESMEVKTLKARVRDNASCRFGYRNSIFKENNGEEIIVAATLALHPGESGAIERVAREKIAYRKERHPLEYPNIGSIFKNVKAESFSSAQLAEMGTIVKSDPFPVVPTAYLISQAGLKGVSYGGAMISPKHPNFIVNVLAARASDIEALIELAKGTVKREFGVALEEEVQRL